MTGLARRLARGALSLLECRTKRPIVVFESDDWGSVRVPSARALGAYRRRYPEHELDHYQSYDGLESEEDLGLLADVLARHPEASGAPVFTLNFATANPGFGRLEVAEPHEGFFSYEPVSETYRREHGGQGVIDLVRARGDAFRPQLHAREHLNATQWMLGASRDPRLAYALGLGMVGLDPGEYHALDALNRNNRAIDLHAYLEDAARLFEGLFGFASESFIPPCYVLGGAEGRGLAALGVATMQGGRFLNTPKADGSLARRPRLLGRRDRFGMVALIRNCSLEPARYYRRDLGEESCVADAIAGLERALALRQPAVFCTHRVNWTSRVDAGCREYSLRCLEALLAHIGHEHPDVVYMASDKLGRLVGS